MVLLALQVEISLWAGSAYFSLIGTNCQRQERSLPNQHSDVSWAGSGQAGFGMLDRKADPYI